MKVRVPAARMRRRERRGGPASTTIKPAEATAFGGAKQRRADLVRLLSAYFRLTQRCKNFLIFFS
jgi:hypothetical protein